MERKAAPVIYLQNNGQVLTWGKRGWQENGNSKIKPDK